MSKDSPTLDEKLSLSLIKCRVRCLVLGGVACNIYGSTRMSEDTDLWVDPTQGGTAWIQHLIMAAKHCNERCHLICLRNQSTLGNFPEDFHPDSALKKLEALIEEDAVIRLQNETGTLDAFYTVNGLDDFEAAWKQSIPCDESLRVLSVPDLIKTKKDTGRQRDQDDIQFLEKLLKSL